MTLLVLCVDRDNDLGLKTGLPTPVIGREGNLEAAVALGLADPEDTDTNSILAAINVHDDLKREGHDVQIATICGHKNVGTTSDRILAHQLDDVLGRSKPDACIFVTDGAEDEHILPLVTSRVRVDAVKRVIVRQNPDIEGAYYVIKKAIEDEKIQRSVFVPGALALLVYGLAAVSGHQEIGLGAISLTLGTFFLIKILNLEKALTRASKDVYAGLVTGRLALFTSFLAFALLIAGALLAYQKVQDGDPETTLFQSSIVFVKALVWWAVGASLVAAGGRVLDAYLRHGVVLWSYWIVPFALVSAGLIVSSVLAILGRLLLDGGASLVLQRNDMVQLVAGVVVAFLGWTTSAAVRRRRAGLLPESEAEAAPGFGEG